MSKWPTPLEYDPTANVSAWGDDVVIFGSDRGKNRQTLEDRHDDMDPDQARVLAAALIAAADEAESDQSDQPKGSA